MFVFVMLSQPCDHLLGKGWPLGLLVCDVFLCFCHFEIFPYGVPGQVWYLIVLIPDLCLLLYLESWVNLDLIFDLPHKPI